MHRAAGLRCRNIGMLLGLGIIVIAYTAHDGFAYESSAEAPDWGRGAAIADGGRSNPYEWSPEEFTARRRSGTLHSLLYPVEVTGTLIPDRPIKKLLEDTHGNPIASFTQWITRTVLKVKRFDDLMARLGLHDYPQTEGKGAYFVPFPDGARPTFRMGYTPMGRQPASGFTLACATCHTAELFGQRVVGLTNRFPRANELFLQGKTLLQQVNPSNYRLATGASPEEMEMYSKSRDHLRFVGGRAPAVLGLDTSLAQVALSLAHRAQDESATMDPKAAAHPRDDLMNHVRADSKPMVWWNLKYKDRWLSDGSIISGNPVLTNFIWNEIGRGTDLNELKEWFTRNERTIVDLTTAVFASEAPRYTDFFPAERINLEAAKRGEKVFVQRCAGCHGIYEKRWSLPESESLPLIEKLETFQVHYRTPTPVINVGTDPGRYQGMQSLADGLNPLTISKDHGIVIEPQHGYVPPPLVGVWSRWPYFHNNSAPNLCAVLTQTSQRPKVYYAGPPIDPERDFDDECNGYPLGNRAPKEWRDNPELKFDTSVEGLSNRGHDEAIFVSNGLELLSGENKKDLIQFLKTL